MTKDIENTALDQAQTMTFEEAMSQLEDIVRRLEGGKIKLEEALSAYEQGAMLKKICEEKLSLAKLKIDKIRLSADGKPIGTEEL